MPDICDFLFDQSSLEGSPTAKVPHGKNTQFPRNQNCSWMGCSCFVSLSASSHSQCLLWHLLLSDIFILLCDPHLVCNLRVPMCSSQACSLTIPSSLPLFFIFFFFVYSSSLTSFSFFCLLNFIFLQVPIMNPKLCQRSARNTLDAHPFTVLTCLPCWFFHSCAAVSNQRLVLIKLLMNT